MEDLAVFRKAGMTLILVATRRNELYVESFTHTRYVFDVTFLTQNVNQPMLGIRELEYVSPAYYESLTLYRLQTRSIVQIGDLSIFARNFDTVPSEGYAAELSAVPRPSTDIRIVTYGVICYGFRTLRGTCIRGATIGSEVFHVPATCQPQKSCGYTALQPRSFPPRIPLHYTRADLEVLKHSPVPVLAPRSVPALNIGDSPAGRIFHRDGISGYEIVVGLGKRCRFEYICTRATVTGEPGRIVSCDPFHPHDGSRQIFDLCGRSGKKISNGLTAWYRRYTCGSSCYFADMLVAGVPGTVYLLSGGRHSLNLDAYIDLAQSLTPFSGKRHSNFASP